MPPRGPAKWEPVDAAQLVRSSPLGTLHFKGALEMRTPPEMATSPVSAGALRRALADECALAEARELSQALETARVRASARGRATPPGQPGALEFLSRACVFNRFLFCEPSDPDSFANNRARGWDDSNALSTRAGAGRADGCAHRKREVAAEAGRAGAQARTQPLPWMPTPV